MVTIKDIAKLSNTSHGTVSNVLNNKGNVSSDKIKRVLDAVKELNYVPNVNAKNLRKGYADKMYLILPNLDSQGYRDIYKSFSINAEKENFDMNLLITDNDIKNEIKFLSQLTSEINFGMKVAVVTSLPYGEKYPDVSDEFLESIIFLLNDYIDSKHFVSYDYELIVDNIWKEIQFKNFTNICIVKNKVPKSEELIAQQKLERLASVNDLNIDIIGVDPFRSYSSLLDSINNTKYDLFLILSHDLTTIVKDVVQNFTYHSNSTIISISPYTLFPDSSITHYEIDFSTLGKETFDLMKDSSIPITQKRLQGIGIRDWLPSIAKRLEPLHLKLLSVDNPSAQILRNLAVQYSLLTNIFIEVDIMDYNSVYEAFLSNDAVANYDIIRCDLNWMSWFGKDIYKPIDMTSDELQKIDTHLIPEVRDYYLSDGEHMFALPFSPSSQVLYYRKDLFERSDIKRQYFEKYKVELRVPTTFHEFDEISEFFTKSITDTSPTDYGLTITTGNSGVLGSELLSRYYALSDRIVNDNDHIEFDHSILVKALESLQSAIRTSNPSQPKWWTDTANEFAEGRTAMAIMYSNYAPKLLSLNSKVIGKIGEAIVPGNNPLLGGGAIGVSKGSSHDKEALDFITWLSKETIATQASYLGNLPNTIPTYNTQDIMDIYPWFKTTYDSIQLATCQRTRLSKTRKFNEREFLEIIGDRQIINQLISGVSLNSIADSIIDKLESSKELLTQIINDN